MSLEMTSGDPVHFPARRDLFQFDSEVASIFDNMAPRAIPLYNEVHRMHVAMCRNKLAPGAVVADIGSSTGHLFRNIERELGLSLAQAQLRPVALDVSDPMMGRLGAEFPTVGTITADLCEAPDLNPKADVLFCLYTLQFIHPSRKALAYDWVVRNTALGGVIVLGQKDKCATAQLEAQYRDEYFAFRRANGYTQAEIDAKTEALKGSMFPVTYDELVHEFSMRGIDLHETSRWLQFSTCMGVRRY